MTHDIGLTVTGEAHEQSALRDDSSSRALNQSDTGSPTLPECLGDIMTGAAAADDDGLLSRECRTIFDSSRVKNSSSEV